jgi:hypothetical protein
MTRDRLLLVGAAGAVGFILWKWGIAAPSVAAGWVSNVFARGNQLSYDSVIDGVVQEVPSVLTDMATAVLGADADADTYSLARIGRSEGVDGMEYRMHVVLNDISSLLAQGYTAYNGVTKYATYSKVDRANGHYSAQNLGKRVASTKDPFEGDYALAAKVIADHDSGIDPTNGATKFVDKSGPFYIHDPNTGNSVKTDYAGIVAAWGTDGYVPNDNLPGASSNFVVFTRTA